MGRVEIEQCERLLQDKQMLLAPCARQGPGDLVSIFFAAIVAQGGEGLRIALARDNGADDALPGVTRDLTERLRQLDSHL